MAVDASGAVPGHVWRHRLRPAGLALLLSLAGSATAVLADQPSARLCTTETSDVGTQACLHAALDAADEGLNAAYRKALSVIDADDRGAKAKAETKSDWKVELAAAQRAWIAFRDADCGDVVLSEWSSGSGATAAGYACRYDKTLQRRDEILSRYPLH